MKEYDDIDPFGEEEWEEDKKEILINKLSENGFFPARMISWSKSGYRKLHPDHFVMFNANSFTDKFGKIWHGDIDITLDANKLKQISDEIGITLYILYEIDGRFGNENREEFKNKSMGDTENGLAEKMQEYFYKENLRKKRS